MNETVYKIRNKRTGQWSTGSSEPRWQVKGGKFWRLRSHAEGHFRGVRLYEQYRPDLKKYLQDAEIVEFTLSNPRVVTK